MYYYPNQTYLTPNGYMTTTSPFPQPVNMPTTYIQPQVMPPYYPPVYIPNVPLQPQVVFQQPPIMYQEPQVCFAPSPFMVSQTFDIDSIGKSLRNNMKEMQDFFK